MIINKDAINDNDNDNDSDNDNDNNSDNHKADDNIKIMKVF